MMESNAQTAVTYINNLLLARGLLRNGQAVEFAGSGAQVINLVHDLVLRRDRDQEHVAEAGQNLLSANAIVAQQKQTIARLESQCAELERQKTTAITQERNATNALKVADTRNRQLRDESNKLKACVTQIRTQCATDIRRRDGELQRLKKHLEGRRGREGAAVVIVTPTPTKPAIRDELKESDSLRSETNEFLAEMGRTLIAENEDLTNLARNTLSTLSEVMGLDSPNPGAVKEHVKCAQVAQSTTEVLNHLRGLLTNPSFVSVEEVQVREEEIQRLREAWESMATRWREAVALMAGWKQRMISDGETVKLEDLKGALELEAPSDPEHSREDVFLHLSPQRTERRRRRSTLSREELEALLRQDQSSSQ